MTLEEISNELDNRLESVYEDMITYCTDKSNSFTDRQALFVNYGKDTHGTHYFINNKAWHNYQYKYEEFLGKGETVYPEFIIEMVVEDMYENEGEILYDFSTNNGEKKVTKVRDMTESEIHQWEQDQWERIFEQPYRSYSTYW